MIQAVDLSRLKKFARICLPVGILAFASLSAQAQDGSAVDLGKQVFDRWCAACHAAGPGMPGTAALEVLYRGEKPALLEQRSDLLPAVTRAFVRNGVSVMPPFRKTEISDAELDALADYLAD
jgi:mono/diheme cytochrome c family protein